MKKFICLTLCVLMALASMTSLVACSEKTVKLGLGLCVANPTATNASEDGNGKAQATVTIAAVTLDATGKIVACQLDTVDTSVEYTLDGTSVLKADAIKTKYEMGTNYGMVAYGGSAKEWFEQADAFETVVAGKTIDEVKALVAEGGKGTEAVITAGCTIAVTDFVKAIEKAVANAVDTTAKSGNALKLGVYTQQTNKDATADVNGSNKLESTIFAATLDASGKVTAAASDCIAFDFTFDATGASTFDTTKAVQSKREQGTNYGMTAYGGAAKEWFEQADAFNASCVGKTISEISGLMGADNYGNADVKAAGCTILVNGFVKAAAKIG